MDTLITDTKKVTIRRVAVSEMDNNVYLLTSKGTGRQILIDAANDVDRIMAMVTQARDDGPDPAIEMIITTHRHSDHLGALTMMAQRTKAVQVAGRDDATAITALTGVVINQVVDHGDEIAVPGIDLVVIGLRGHTPGAVALAYAEPGQPVQLFTGDSLFPGGPGYTASPADFQSLMTDLEVKVFDHFNDDTVVWPGHGAPTTLGVERVNLPAWWQRGW